MKTRWILVMVVCMVTLLHAFKAGQKAGLGGRITPGENALTLWLIQGSDSVCFSPTDGSFVIETKPGLYKVLIDAKQPYKDVLIENIEVIVNRTTDIGEIRVTQ